jgi:transaldolase
MNEMSTNAIRPTAVADSGKYGWPDDRAHDTLIDIAATDAGFAAAEQALFAGINVNLTLVCSPRQVGAARAAHRRALARRLEAHLPVQRIACVASMPLTPIDRAVDTLLPPSASSLRGCAAIAAARIACADAHDDQAFAVFAAFGATPLQLRWTDASAAHRAALDEPDAGAATMNAAHAQAMLAQLGRYGIDLDTIGNDLLRAGLTQCGHADAQLPALPA